MAIQVTTVFDPDTFTATHLLVDVASGEAAIVDPVLAFDQKSGRTDTHAIDTLLAQAERQQLTLRYVLETHAHADHLTSADYIRQRCGAEIVIGQPITQVQQIFADIFNEGDAFLRDGSQFDRLVGDGDVLKLGDTAIEVLATPGHTPACVSYLVAGEAVFVGDTLFMPDVGSARCDFPGGDARTLYQSAQRLLALDDDVTMYLCHDYPPAGDAGEARPVQTQVSVKQQRLHNIHLREGISEDEFVALRRGRDAGLDVPRLILPSLQVNIRAGAFPQAEDNGSHYLKIPLNQL
jgi:glyoxylase-like metal-dependent hydrolase (beta-lactamase superfamily II)